MKNLSWVSAACCAAAAWGANPTERRWVAADGRVDEASCWNGRVLPAQGSAAAAGEMAFFTGAGDWTVRFPAGGWTDTGVYYFSKDLDDGSTLTFDATGTSWTFGAGKYFSNWQVFTLSGGATTAQYPHILQVTLTGNGQSGEPVFTLTDGVVRLRKHATDGTVLSLERGTWDFTRTGSSGTDHLLFFNAEKGGHDEVVLCAGTSLKTPGVQLTPSVNVRDVCFRVEGGAHEIANLTIGALKSGDAGTTPVLFEMTGGSLTSSGNVVIGNRATTDATRLHLAGGASFTASRLTVANSAAGARMDVGGESKLSVGETLLVNAGTASAPGACGTLELTDQACAEVRDVLLQGANGGSAVLSLADDVALTVRGFLRPAAGRPVFGARSEVVVGGRAKLVATATSDGANGGGVIFGDDSGSSPEAVARMVVQDDAVVETAARTTIGQYSSVSNVLEVCGRGVFRNTSASGIILGRGAKGRGYLVVKDDARVELTGTQDGLTLSGNLQYGDNLGGGERVDVLGGTVASAGGLLLGGTNAWVELAGGTTSFKTWVVGGEPRYRIADPDWILPTNTVRITGGVHAISGYSTDGGGISLKVGATNGNARVLLEGGELKASSMVQIGHVAATGAPGMLTMTGGRFAIAQKDGNAAGDSQLMVGWQNRSRGRVELLGGELVANNLRGSANGTSELIADGGRFTVLNVVKDKSAIYAIGSAQLGAKGLEVAVASHLCATNAQAYTDLGGASGLFTKTGTGTLTATVESRHARTAVAEGRLRLAPGVKTFGRSLTIAEGAYVLVDVPAETGSHEVLRLDTPLAEADLARIVPATWGEGLSYVVAQTTEGGTTTVSCTVAAGGPAAREIGETAVYDAPQMLAGTLSVTAPGVVATFAAPVEIVGTTLVIDVPAGSRVVFAQPVASAYTAVVKRGAGEVVFQANCPGFLGTWTQEGGVFDVAADDFAPAASGFSFATGTLRHSGAVPGALDVPVTVAGGSAQKRVVVDAVSDFALTRGFNSTGGGLVKTGAGALTLDEPSGTFSLNTGSVAAMDGAVAELPENGASPADASVKQNNATAGAGLQILSGVVRVHGAGRDTTTVKNEQAIYVGTGFAGQTAEVGLEVSGCRYVADGTTRSTVVGHNAKSTEFRRPYLSVTDASYVNHRFLLGNGSPAVDVYPTLAMTNATVATESGFQIGQANDRVHPVVRLCNAQVTQYRLGYAIGHVFYRDFDVELSSNALLNATYTSNAGNNWHGIQFAAGAWGVLKVTGGSTLQTSRFESLNTGATAERHVDVVFDGGVLEMTSDASGNALSSTTRFAKPEVQGFVSEGDGLTVRLGEGVAHTFATPFRGAGAIVKSGAGTMALAAVADGGAVFRGTGDVVLKAGALDLGGLAETNVCCVGAGGEVRNGICAVKAVVGGEPLSLGGGVALARVEIDAAGTSLVKGQVLPVAVFSDAAPGLVGCRVKVPEPQLRGELSVADGTVFVTLRSRRGCALIIR